MKINHLIIDTMKTKYKSILLFFSLLLLSACDKDGIKVLVSDPDSSKLVASSKSVLLSKETNSSVVLSFAWNSQNLITSEPNMGVTDILSSYLIASLSSDISNPVETWVSSNSKECTGAE